MARTTRRPASLAIIIPCYNNAETLAEALQSAVNQDYPDFEIHVCDNGSTDGSQEIIESFASPLVVAALHDTTVARTDNWNRAYAAGFGKDYLVTLHADDRLRPGALRAIAKAARSGPAMIHGGFRKITYDGQPRPGNRFPLNYSSTGARFRELLLLNNMVAMPGVTIRTDVFREAGGWDPAWQYLQDMELWWRCSDLGQITYIADILGDHRDYKEPQAMHRHAEEHLRWATGKLATIASPRLRNAASDGLRTYLNWLADSETDDQGTGSYALALKSARLIVDAVGRPQVDAIRRQRMLRLLAALTPRLISGKDRLVPLAH